jgi:hypothetical protein
MNEKKLSQEEKERFNRAVKITDTNILTEQDEHGEYSSKIYWKKPFFYCIFNGCQKRTNLSRKLCIANMAKQLGLEGKDLFGHLCEEHYAVTHAFGLVKIAEHKNMRRKIG